MGLNFKAITKVLGILTLIEGVFMLAALATAMYYGEWAAASALLTTSLLCISVGFVILTQMKFDKIILRAREGYFIACASWIYCSVLGALPIYFCGEGFSFISCLFESVAGFSTTGCSVLDISSVPLSILMWRALCHWLGGMGILVLLISIFPLWGINNQAIATAETPGPHIDKLEATYSDTGKFLYLSYLALSAAEYAILVMGPMDWYNAFLTTCSSISTAGLIITSDSAWLYDLPYVRIVVMIFTILSSMNYMIYFLMLKKRWKEALTNIEARAFLVIIGVSSLLIASVLRLSGTYTNLWSAVKDSLCQVVSLISTSGYYVCDYTSWPAFAVTLLMLLLLIGGCSFSTSGSLKVIRVVILYKLVKRGLLKQIHPRMVKAVMLDDTKPVSAKTAAAVTTHTLLFFSVLMIGCLLLSFNNLDMETTLTTALGMFTNTGMALGIPGCSGYFGMLNEFSQIVMSFLMIAGRLEMYAIVIIFAKSFWLPDKAVSI